MRDQADKLRQLVRETVNEHPSLKPGVPLIVVSGGIEGVGASTIAIQLARELARMGKRIVLADANLQQPDLTNRLAIDPEDSLVDILSGQRSAVEVLRPLGDSIQLLPGRWAPEAPPEMDQLALKRLLSELRSLSTQADAVIIDAGDGASPWLQQLWKAAHQVLLVTTLRPDAMKASYSVVKLAPWGDVDGKVRLVINQSEQHRQAKHAGDRFVTTCRRFLGVNLCKPLSLINKATSIDSLKEGASASNDDIEFKQSVSLLSAEVLRSCLVLSNHRSRNTEKVDASTGSSKSVEMSN